jgi:hypothetical protein
MISLRLAVPAVLLATAAAGCFTYFVNPPPPIEVDQRLPPTAPDLTSPQTGTPTNVDQRPSVEEKAAAFQQAAAAILRPLPNALASADEPPITERIPLPKKRPIPRP